jgi:hypothetical protein
MKFQVSKAQKLPLSPFLLKNTEGQVRRLEQGREQLEEQTPFPHPRTQTPEVWLVDSEAKRRARTP